MILLPLAASNPLEHVAQHISHWLPGSAKSGLWSFPIVSNHILMQILAAALIVLILPRAVRMRRGTDEIGRHVPRGFGNALEAICVAIRDQVAMPNLGARFTPIFLPYLLSAFFFILTCNLLGMIPLGDIVHALTGKPTHLIGGTSTGNLYVTSTLAVLTLILIIFNGLRYNGIDYIKHFFMGPPGLNVFIALLEFMGLFFKTMALAMRLFANMLAGHILLAVLLSFIGPMFKAWGAGGGVAVSVLVILGSVAINFLELLVAFLQAFIFTVLTAVFIGQAVNIHHEDHEHEHGHEPAPAHAGAH
jgi:F-type H+-transporting ATPase subunit a